MINIMTIPSILLILLVLGLFVAMFYACFHSTTGPSSITNLKAHLNLLKSKFANHTPVDPHEERCVMETFQNRIKTSCSQKVISGNEDLKALFAFNCQSINGMMKTAEPSNKTMWLKYGALMNDFNDQYFTGKTNEVLQP
jgi:hypothetical protein